MDSRIKFECGETMNHILDTLSGPLNSSKRKRERNKRVSAPKRMANPFRFNVFFMLIIVMVHKRSIDLSPSLGVVDVSTWYSNISRPLHIDIGCAKGRCIERLAARFIDFLLLLSINLTSWQSGEGGLESSRSGNTPQDHSAGTRSSKSFDK
jgi:hypothetical protein